MLGIGPAADFDEEARIPTGQTSGTSIASEGLRRAVSILRLLPQFGGSNLDLSAADAKFLADQAGLALEGLPLQLELHDNAIAIPQLKAKEVEEFQSLSAEVVQAERTLAEVVRERRQVEREQARSEVDKNVVPPSLESYQNLLRKEREAKAVVQQKRHSVKESLEIVIKMHPAK